jgi:branched-chain amino acid transport system substrate-binding protein
VRQHLSRGARLVALTAVLALGATACGGSDDKDKGGSSGSGKKALSIAFFGAKTGENAQLGLNELNGVKLALKEHNAKADVSQVTLQEFDSAGDPAQANPLAPKVAKSGAVAVVGLPFSGESKVAVPVLEEAGVPSISPSATNVKLAANGWKTWHRVVANDDVQGPKIAGFIQTGLAAKKVAVVDDQSDYGKGLAEAVRKTLGPLAVVTDSVSDKTDDYSPTVNKIKPAGVDAVFYGGYYSAAAKFLKALRNSGVKAKFVSGDGSADAQIIALAGAASEGAFLGCPCQFASTASPDEATKKFAEDYKAAYGKDPAEYSAEGYDATNAFLMAIDAGKTTSSDINDYLKTIDFKGVSKQIKFADTGELEAKLVFMHEVKDGKIVSLGQADSAKP